MIRQQTRRIGFSVKSGWFKAVLALLLVAVLVLGLPMKQAASFAQNNPLKEAIDHARNAEKTGKAGATMSSSRRSLEEAQAHVEKNKPREALAKMLLARESIVTSIEANPANDSFRQESQSALANLEKAIVGMGGYSLRTETTNSVFIAYFQNPYGATSIYFPLDAASGDTISISAATRALGATAEIQNANQARAQQYSYSVNGTTLTTEAVRIDLRQTDSLTVEVRNQFGGEVATLNLPLSLSRNQNGDRNPAGFYVPAIITSGAAALIKGPFDGNAGNTHVKIEGQDARVIAESPRATVFEAPKGITGRGNLDLREGNLGARGPVYSASLDLSADALHLLKGQKTNIQISISGLTGYPKDVPVVLENQTPSVISLSNETIVVPSTQISTTGTTTITRTATSLSTGAFNITATISPSDLLKLTSDDTTRISAPSPPTTGQQPQVSGLPSGVSISFISSGNTTGTIGQITVDNKSWRKVDVYLQPYFIPSDGKYQSYVVPHTTDFTVPPGETFNVPILGYCTDVGRPPVPSGASLPNAFLPPPSYVLPTRANVPTTGIVPVVPGTTVPVSSPESKPDLVLDAALRIIPAFDRLKGSGQITTPFSGDPAKERETVIQQTIWIYTGQTGDQKYGKEDVQKVLETQYTTATGKPITEASPEVREKIKEGTNDFWSAFTLTGREAKVIRTPETEKTTPVADTTARSRKCLRYPVDPQIDNRVGWDLIGALNRNRALNRQPSLGFDLNNIRYDYRDKVATAEAFLRSLETTLSQFLSSAEKRELAQASEASRHDKLLELIKRKCGNKGLNQKDVQSFPKFPREAFSPKSISAIRPPKIRRTWPIS